MRWKHPIIAAAALVLAAAIVAEGQTGREVFPFPVTTFELDNGLQVVGVDYDSPGIVAYYTVVRTGSRNEVEPGFSGYAHFFEHMMFRGTDKYPTEAYNAVVKRIGADSNAFTTSDWTTYYIVASSDALETIMDLESDRFRNLRYSEDDFRTEAGAILGEYNLNFSNPVSLLRERLHDLAYTTHPYKHTTIGLLEDIRDMPNHYDYSLQFYDRYYRPENSIVVVVGDFDQAELERLAAEYYGGWERGDFEPQIPQEPAADRGALGPHHVAQPDPAVPDDGLPRPGVLGPAHRHAGPRRAVPASLLGDLAALPQALSGGAGGRRPARGRARQSRCAAVHDHRTHHRPHAHRVRARRGHR